MVIKNDTNNSGELVTKCSAKFALDLKKGKPMKNVSMDVKFMNLLLIVRLLHEGRKIKGFL